jgi:hypothetical protein
MAGRAPCREADPGLKQVRLFNDFLSGPGLFAGRSRLGSGQRRWKMLLERSKQAGLNAGMPRRNVPLAQSSS